MRKYSMLIVGVLILTAGLIYCTSDDFQIRLKVAGMSKSPGYLEIAKMGPKVIPYVAPKIESKNQEESLRACQILARLGKPAVHPLNDSLKRLGEDQKSLQLRWWITDALRNIGPEAQEAVPTLQKDLHSHDGVIRNLAAGALGKIDAGLASKEALPNVLEDVKQGNYETKFWASQALKSIGPVNDEASEAIQNLPPEFRKS